MTNPIAGSSGIGGVLERIAALEARFATVRRSGSAPAASGSGDPTFATSLAQAGGTAAATPSTSAASVASATSATSAASATSAVARTLGVAGQGAGAVRGIAALAGGMPAAAAVPTAGAPSTASPDLGAKAVEVAKLHLGVPYRWGGTSPSGFDCSGLVQYAYRQLGVDLPRVSRDQARAGQPVASLAEARPGDLVAFGSPVDHIGIYAGGGKMVVAPHTGAVVRVQDITRPIVAIRRVA